MMYQLHRLDVENYFLPITSYIYSGSDEIFGTFSAEFIYLFIYLFLYFADRASEYKINILRYTVIKNIKICDAKKIY